MIRLFALFLALVFAAPALASDAGTLAIGADTVGTIYLTGASKAAVAAPLAFGGDGTAADPAWAGKVVLVTRGPAGVTFLSKLQKIREAGGVAMVLANQPDAPAFAGALGAVVDIPAVTVSKADGAALAARVGETVTLEPVVVVTPPPPTSPPASADLVIALKTGSYTLALADKDALVAIESAVEADWIIPADAAAAFPVGARVLGAALGDGAVTVKGAAGVAVISSRQGNRSVGKGARWEAVKIAPNKWLVSGALDNQNAPVSVGKRVSLWADYEGADPAPSFQWSKDGVALAGQTQVALFFHKVQLADAGVYTVEVKNDAGTATSAPVVLAVNP